MLINSNQQSHNIKSGVKPQAKLKKTDTKEKSAVPYTNILFDDIN